MSVIPVSLRLPEEVWAQVVENAAERRVDPDDVISTALHQYFKPDEETRFAVEQGLRQADAGDLIDHETVVALFEARKIRANQAA